jgi:hypothetical protein
LNGALVGGDDGSVEFKIMNDRYPATVEIRRRGAPQSAPPRCEDLCVAAILGGEKGYDLPKDGIREIAYAVCPIFYAFLRSRGAVAASARATGCRIYNRRRRWPEPHQCTYQSRKKIGTNIYVGYSKSILKIWKKKMAQTYM